LSDGGGGVPWDKSPKGNARIRMRNRVFFIKSGFSDKSRKWDL
jgi:hypothetical protein